MARRPKGCTARPETRTRRLTAVIATLVALGAGGASPAPKAWADREPRVVAGHVNDSLRLSGNVVIEGSLRVGPQGTLFIDEGTMVRMRNGYAPKDEGAGEQAATGDTVRPAVLVVEGRLTCLGTERRPVRFVGDESNDRPWGGIEFRRGKGLVSRTEISGAENGVMTLHSGVRVEDSAITGCNFGAYVNTGSSPRLLRNRISGNGVGVYCLEGSTPLLIANDITDNREVGVSALRQASPEIYLNYLARNRHGVYLTWATRCVINGNVFEDNEYGVYTDRPNDNPVITNCVFTGNRFGVFSVQMSRAEVVNCRLTDNEYAVYLSRLAHASIRGSVISGNRTGVYCGQSSYPVIRGNALFGNRYDIYLEQESAEFNRRTMRDSGEWDISERRQKIERTGQSRKPERIPDYLRGRDDAFLVQGYVDAAGNWWGEATTQRMASLPGEGRIESFRDSRHGAAEVYPDGASYPGDQVRYRPWLEQPPPEAGKRIFEEVGLGHGVPGAGTTRGG